MGRRALEFHDIAFRIRDIEGRAFPLGPVAQLDWASLHAMRGQMPSEFRFIEGFHPEAEVIQVPRLPSGCPATGPADRPIHGDEVEDGPAGAELDQAEVILPSLHSAAEHLAIETEHHLEVSDAQDEVINFADVDHGVPDTLEPFPAVNATPG